MKRIIRQALCFLTIIVLLPYVLTVFINGKNIAVTMEDTEKEIYYEKDGKPVKIPMKEYGTGVLALDISPDADPEVLKAQAILIRTEIYRTMREQGSDTTFTKKFLSEKEMKKEWGMSFRGRYKKIRKAWNETEDQILMYEGNPALTPYHFKNNGHTRNASEAFGTQEYPYLVAKECPADIEKEDSRQTLMLPVMEAEISKQDSMGYALEVKCGQEVIPAEKFKDTYHIPSLAFELEKTANGLKVISTGKGHGIGFSQYTGQRMAEEGKNYKEILQYFFEGTSIEVVAQIITKKE